jgi:hypothetical protein
MIMVLHLTHSPMPLHIHMVLGSDTPPHYLKDSNTSPKVKIMKEEGIGARSLVRNILGVEGHAGVPRWGLGQMTSMSIIHTNLHKPNNKLINVWLEHFWCMDEPHAYTNSQDSSCSDLGDATTFPLIVFTMPSHRAYTQMSFFPRTPKLKVSKFSKLKLPRFWRPITFWDNLRLK